MPSKPNPELATLPHNFSDNARDPFVSSHRPQESTVEQGHPVCQDHRRRGDAFSARAPQQSVTLSTPDEAVVDANPGLNANREMVRGAGYNRTCLCCPGAPPSLMHAERVYNHALV
ncbi:hypothetical protein A0H81_10602 [Grifola frondosa]|uniref:Uncharacterized protein n=1 Tax=Grifola frondosa TaxID=5627 RepID=A0A1C7M2R2_GRIFR|nr:hypothetical protein A0H81_10602 [Grifola frondosa]